MALIDVNWNPSRTELRVFAGLQLIFFAIVAWMISHRFEGTTLPRVVMIISGIAAVAGLIGPKLLRPVYVIWMAAVLPIGWVVSHVMIAAVFYLMITPFGQIMKLCGRDPMERKFETTAKTYWKTRSQQTDTKRYFRQY